MKSLLWYFSLRTVGCFQSCWRIRMPCIEGQTANFPAFDHDFRCFIVSAIIRHSQHRLGFLRSDAISDQKWNAKTVAPPWEAKVARHPRIQQPKPFKHAPCNEKNRIIITWITTQITNHMNQSQGSEAQLDGSPHPLRHRHVAHHSSDQKIADLSPMKLA